MDRKLTMGEKIAHLIEDFTTDDDGNEHDDVREVLYFLMARAQLIMDTTKYRVLEEIPDPERLAVHTSAVFGMESTISIANDFFVRNQQAIRGAMRMEEIALASMLDMLAARRPDTRLLVLGALSNRFTSMSMVVGIAFGDIVAKEFDKALRDVVRVTEAEHAAIMQLFAEAAGADAHSSPHHSSSDSHGTIRP